MKYSVTSFFIEVGEAILGVFSDGPVICYSKSNNKNSSKGKWQVGDVSVF